ncbi:sugar phosphate isomerase/epimerase family protein [Novosphingobium sp. ST904]|uniref:sugar phosphate isomerase/epimerase family protein n=1 Tax=Novosphingobium sp. ST904 TaxID=1684385 RepID=UPI0006C87121|nr:sugar phosphate isomerase/epimerase family protein [Novosphingobium sp. ST904]KPH66509.1 hypothetical protein ADT71_05565 [Novosphingobium sp. ST904]TCM38715.1 sugar phosphate isomerase/epimerase [Novosphingobium sp. ST904]
MPKFSLDSLTLTDTEPMELIEAAAEAGFGTISLWVQPPALYPSSACTAEKEADCARRIRDTGIAIETLEVFDLHSVEALEAYRPALERGARLGGKTALVLNYSNPDRGQSAELLGKFAEIAAEYGIGANLEPVAGGKTSSLQQAAELIAASGADAGVVLDPFHLIRSGGSVADIAALPEGMIRYVQLCDGPLQVPPEIAASEAIGHRLYPGEGEFPLLEILRAAPSDVTIGIECPSLARVRAGQTASVQAREAMAAIKRILQEA